MIGRNNAPQNGPRRLVVDRSVCAGHGVCYGHSPEVVDCDDSGYPVILQDPLELDQHITAAEEAAVMCPERAMTVELL